MTAQTQTEVRTLYWDQADRRWVLIVMNKPHVKHHKFSRTIVTEADAKAMAESL
jgi:hypothetical protein